MNPILKLTLASGAASGVVAAALVGVPAQAAAPATPVSVTITGNDSPFGEVKSPKRICKAGVTVRVYRQIGTRGGGNDVQVGSPDTTGLQGGKWTWSIGNPGLEDGWKVYAKVKAANGCKAAFSPTMTVDKD